MKKIFSFITSFILLGSFTLLFSQISGDYRSNPGPFSGNWSQSGSWETYNGATWNPAGSAPNISITTNTITIRAGHSITLDTSPNVPNLVIEATGELKNTSSTEYGLILWGDLNVNGSLGGASHNIPIALNNTAAGTNTITGSGIIGLLYFTKTDGANARALDLQASVTLYGSDPFKNNSGQVLTIDHTSGTLNIPNAASLSTTNITYDFNGTSNVVNFSSNALATQSIPSTTYLNLYLSGSNTKLLTGDITIIGTLTLDGTAICDADGNTINYNGASAKLKYSGTTIRTSGDEISSGEDDGSISSGTLNNLQINNSAGVTFISDFDVNGTLTCTAGNGYTNSNMLSLGTSATMSESSGNSIVGNVQSVQFVSTGASTFSNMGFEMSSGADVGLVTVTRKSGDVGVVSVG